MAVFMLNICKFNGCGITFPRLSELIEHIEDVHIDYDPAVVEQKEASQPSCIPLSYVLKFFTEASRREIQNMPPVAEVRRRLLSAPKTPSVRSSTPTGSDMDEDEMLSPSEDSNDSWTTVEEYSSEYILRYGVNRMGASAAAAGPTVQDKPFACPVPGCKKRYKNVNGIKYHSKNGHKKDGKKYQFLSPPTHGNKKYMPRAKKRLTAQEYFWRKWVTVKKAYKCQCGKSYKTAQGLKSHSVSQHLTVAPARSGAGLVVTAAPPALLVTAAPKRPLPDDKLVRIYDALKPKDLPALPTFTIPKHNLSGVNIVRALAPPDRVKFERSPKVTVQARSLAPLSPMAPLAPLTPYGNVGNEA